MSSSISLRGNSIQKLPSLSTPLNMVRGATLPRRHFSGAAERVVYNDIDELIPKKIIPLFPYALPNLTSSLPEQAWDMSVHLYKKSLSVNKCIELMSDPATAESPEVYDRVMALLAPFDQPDKSMVALQQQMSILGAVITTFEEVCDKRNEVLDLHAMRAEAETERKAALAEVMKATPNIMPAEADVHESVLAWVTVADETQAEIDQAMEQLAELEDELLTRVLPKDVDDHRNAILEVRPGTGGDEAMLFARDIFIMYEKIAQHMGWRFEVNDISTTEAGGYREASATISGDCVFGSLKFETGVHRVQRVPATETQGRVHTSTMTVAVLPEVKEVDVVIRDADLRIDVYRASGAGGQHVNTTESAVRITHIPTGTVVTNQDQRSQHKNKEKAMTVLRSRIYEAQRQKLAEERAQMRGEQIGTGDRSERIRTYNYSQSRVSDHRVNYTVHNIDSFMSGEAFPDVLDELRHKERMDILASALKTASDSNTPKPKKGKK